MVSGNAPLEELNFDGNIVDNQRCWKQPFEIFSLASKLSAKNQAATFLHVHGRNEGNGDL